MADPTLLLKRGFSISKKNGKTITSVEELQLGDEIQTIFMDGSITSNVTQKK